jgi:hypothetical protein
MRTPSGLPDNRRPALAWFALRYRPTFGPTSRWHHDLPPKDSQTLDKTGPLIAGARSDVIVHFFSQPSNATSPRTPPRGAGGLIYGRHTHMSADRKPILEPRSRGVTTLAAGALPSFATESFLVDALRQAGKATKSDVPFLEETRDGQAGTN